MLFIQYNLLLTDREWRHFKPVRSSQPTVFFFFFKCIYKTQTDSVLIPLDHKMQYSLDSLQESCGILGFGHQFH